jgi:RNA polymerase sigma-70 factor, ECF subfamily
VSEAYEAITRAQWARVVAAVTRRFGDLDIAEDAATEAFTTQTTSEPNARWWLAPQHRLS